MSSLQDIVIDSAIRTPVGLGKAERDALRQWHPVDFSALVLEAPVAPGRIDAVVVRTTSSEGVETGADESRTNHHGGAMASATRWAPRKHG